MKSERIHVRTTTVKAKLSQSTETAARSFELPTFRDATGFIATVGEVVTKAGYPSPEVDLRGTTVTLRFVATGGKLPAEEAREILRQLNVAS